MHSVGVFQWVESSSKGISYKMIHPHGVHEFWFAVLDDRVGAVRNRHEYQKEMFPAEFRI
jgi:hypothetical protein